MCWQRRWRAFLHPERLHSVGAELHAATSLEDPVWTVVPFAVGTNCVELPLNQGNTFFRLMKP